MAQYVSHNGGIWRLRNTSFAKLITLIEQGEGYDLDKLGIQVAYEIVATDWLEHVHGQKD
jgi:hypothetical protein